MRSLCLEKTYAIMVKDKWAAAIQYSIPAIQSGVGVRKSIWSALDPGRYFRYHTHPSPRAKGWLRVDSRGTPGFTSPMSSWESKDFHGHSDVFPSPSLRGISLHSLTHSFLVLIHLADEWTEHSRVSRDVRIYSASASAHHADIVA